jgi:hypothetical protein
MVECCPITQTLDLWDCHGNFPLLTRAKQRFEKSSDQRTKPLIDHKQDNKGKNKKPKQTHKNFEQFKNQPQSNQTGQKNKKWIFKKIVHYQG